MEARTGHSFACDRCRSGKRKCDAAKPECGLCKKMNKACVYSIETRTRKRKYWDEDYVRNLENQVQCLLSALKAATGQDGLAVPTQSLHMPASRSTMSGVEAEVEEPVRPDQYISELVNNAPDISSGSDRSHIAQERSETAMEELSVMMWRTNIGDGVTIINDGSTGSDHRVENTLTATSSRPVTVPDTILSYCENSKLLHDIANCFLENINAEHQFTSYKTTDFLLSYPNQRSDLLFLHSAILASGAVFSYIPEQDHIGDEFARFAESLIFTCFRESPSIAIVQGLCILSERALALGRDHFGWTFISMAAGMSVHLRLHVLALDECEARSWKPSREDIRTFWMFYMTDRSAISILGRNCALPWRRVNVPNFDATIDLSTADISEISFAWQCKMWYVHDNYMDQIFSPNFETMPLAQQVQLLVSTHDALRTFYQSRDARLDITPNTGISRHILFFHMSYQMAQLITLPPFLRFFTTSRKNNNNNNNNTTTPAHSGEGNVTVLILRTLTGAASTMIRLTRMYRDLGEWTTAKPNPVIIHHLLSAAIVQLMNATSSSPSLRKSSSRQLRMCMELLTQLRGPWRPRVDKSIKVIRVLAQRWGVLGALPLDYSYRVEPEEKDTGAPSAAGENSVTMPYPPATGLWFADPGSVLGVSSTEATGPLNDAEVNILGHNMSFDAFDEVTGLPFTNWMQEFEALNGYDWELGELNNSPAL